MDEGFVSCFDIGIVVVSLIIGSVWLMTQISRVTSIRDRIRQIYPDASLSWLINAVRFQYKGFKADLRWFDGKNSRYGHTGQGQSSGFKVVFPEEIRKPFAEFAFKIKLNELIMIEEAISADDVRQQLREREFHPLMMGALLQDRAFFQALTEIMTYIREGAMLTARPLDTVAKSGGYISLTKKEFFILVPQKPPAADSMVSFLSSCTKLFDRVIAAAGAAEPAIWSLSPIAENFTGMSSGDLNEAPYEDIYVLDDDSPMERRYADSESWEPDDHALPERRAGKYDMYKL